MGIFTCHVAGIKRVKSRAACGPAEEDVTQVPMIDDSVVGGVVETRAQLRRKERPVKPLNVAPSDGLGAISEEFKSA